MSVTFPDFKAPKDANGHYPRTETFVGCVLDTYEMNGYDDSDWYAIVWDESTQSVHTVNYDTTRGYMGGSAVVDATPENIEKARMFATDVLTKNKINDHKIVGAGKTVKSLTVRGKAKGITGTVLWLEKDRYARPYGGVTPKMAVVKVTAPESNPHYGRKLYIYPARLEVTNELTPDVENDYRQEAWLEAHRANMRSLFHGRWGMLYRTSELYA